LPDFCTINRQTVPINIQHLAIHLKKPSKRYPKILDRQDCGCILSKRCYRGIKYALGDNNPFDIN